MSNTGNKRGELLCPYWLLEECRAVYQQYPELRHLSIEVKVQSNSSSGFMYARPKPLSLLRDKRKRSYKIVLKPYLNLKVDSLPVRQIPSYVLKGWLAHEMGHLVDYYQRSSPEMLIFGLRYSTDNNYLEEAEWRADSIAIAHGFGMEVVATKLFILKSAPVDKSYRRKIEQLYISPREALRLYQRIKSGKTKYSP